jgi:hypothetical protein
LTVPRIVRPLSTFDPLLFFFVCSDDADADKYFRAFAMALEPKRSWKTKVASLDAIEKMIGE